MVACNTLSERVKRIMSTVAKGNLSRFIGFLLILESNSRHSLIVSPASFIIITPTVSIAGSPESSLKIGRISRSVDAKSPRHSSSIPGVSLLGSSWVTTLCHKRKANAFEDCWPFGRNNKCRRPVHRHGNCAPSTHLEQRWKSSFARNLSSANDAVTRDPSNPTRHIGLEKPALQLVAKCVPRPQSTLQR